MADEKQPFKLRVDRSKLSGSGMLSVRTYLVLLVAGTLLPVVLFAIAVVHKLSAQEQAKSEQRILLATRNLAETIEHEFSITARTLQAVGASEALEREDLATFHSEAKRVAESQATWLSVILLTPDGRQLVNTRQPFGKPLPSVVEPASLQYVVKTQQPTVGNLAVGKVERSLAFPVRVPIIREQDVQYILTAIITQKALANVVHEQTTIDGEWTRTVVDGQGVVVARTRNPTRFVGQRGTPSFLKRIGETTEGIYRDTTLEGMQVYVAFCRVGDSAWTVAITVPVEVIQGPSRRAMLLVIGSGLVLLLISGVGAFIFSRQISISMTSAAAAAEALAKEESPQVSPASIKEVALLGQSLELAADLLSQRDQERAENLIRAEAAREEAEAANRIKDEFLAVLSHELRSPLNPILGWSTLLQTKKLDEAKTAQALATIQRNAKLQAELIEDLLDVSRILRGKLSLHGAPVNLVAILESALETVRLAAEAKSITLAANLAEDVAFIWGDATRLQQVIWNLLSNAVKFTPEGGQVTVSLVYIHSAASSPLSSYAQITVSDTGQGIAPDFLPYVFDYFRQGNASTTRKFGGLGLGLAIVRHLVELHGGTVRAESPGEGQGATFTLDLPLMSLEAELEPGSRSAEAMLDLSGLQVLVVDDEADSREFIAFLIEQYGAKVMRAASAEEALAALSHSQPDILLSDIGMPEVDGYRLMQQIRALPAEAGGQIPAIALTAYAAEIDYQQAMAAGFQQHVAKPVEPQKLVQAIVSLVAERQ